MVGIRIATIDDLEDIRKLNQELFVYENGNFDKTINVKSSLGDDHKKRFVENIKNDFTIVALEEGIIVGYLVGKITKAESYRNVGGIAELDSFFVDEKFRSMKIGHQLIDEFKKWVRSMKIKRMSVTASAGNARAIKFYKKEGFGDYDLVLEQEIA